MYVRINVFRVKPENRERFIEVMTHETMEVVAKEPRSPGYYFLQDSSDPLVFVIIAIFEDIDAFNYHMESPHLKEMLAYISAEETSPERVGRWITSNIAPDDKTWLARFKRS